MVDNTIKDLEFKKFGKRKSQKPYVRVLDSEAQIKNTIETVKTTITTAATKITTPDNATEFFIYHKTASVSLHVGDESVDGSGDYFELVKGEKLELSNMQKNNNNELYGTVTAGTLVVYATGIVKI